jgi:hypothetical protein
VVRQIATCLPGRQEMARLAAAATAEDREAAFTQAMDGVEVRGRHADRHAASSGTAMHSSPAQVTTTTPPLAPRRTSARGTGCTTR